MRIHEVESLATTVTNDERDQFIGNDTRIVFVLVILDSFYFVS